MKRLLTICLVVLFITVGYTAGDTVWDSPQTALPHGPSGSVIDQYQTSYGGGGYFWEDRYLAQTFTCGIGGLLSHVNAYIDVWDGQPSVPATISLVETQNGVPSGSVLGSVDVPSLTLGWFSFDFSQQSVNLSVGTRYGIVFSNDDPSPQEPSNGVGIEWDGNPYIGGGLWQWTSAAGWEQFNPFGLVGDSDMVFETWMVPEPTMICLLSLGGLTLLRKRRT